MVSSGLHGNGRVTCMAQVAFAATANEEIAVEQAEVQAEAKIV